MSDAMQRYEACLASSSALKLRALGSLALGTEEAELEARALLREAAGLERLAIEALSPCPPETGLAGAIQEYWCLIQVQDPDALLSRVQPPPPARARMTER